MATSQFLNLDVDGTLAANSDTIVPSQKAIKTYADTKADKTNSINGIPLSNSGYFYATSTTAAATTKKEVSIPEITTLSTGQMIIVQPTITSTVADSTIQLNSFNEYPMRYNNAAITTDTDSIVWNANYPTLWVFDGTYWVFVAHGVDNNTTYTLNYLYEAGLAKAGGSSSSDYAVSRYSLVMQKPDMTWEKITSMASTYSTATSKSVNTNGFIPGTLRRYNSTTAVAGLGTIATNTLQQQSASVDMRYSTNCGGTPAWTAGEYIYLVGTIVDDLFYLDTTTWWTNALPNSNDGKYYMVVGRVITTDSYSCSLFDSNRIYYHDGNGIKEWSRKPFKGADGVNAGEKGLVPAPAATDNTKFLKGDGTWSNPTAATAWGNITGTLSDQTDLQNAINSVKRNIGEIVPSMLPLTDAGLHLLDGSLISGAGTYAEFVTYIAGLVSTYPDSFETEANWQASVSAYGVCGKFVYDSVNNTVRLPKITGIMEGTVDATALGDLVAAGLPNITGKVGAVLGSNTGGLGLKEGAFSDSVLSGTANLKGTSSALANNNIWFDASDSNSIYGNSSTVQPQTIKGFYYIVLANSVKTEIEVDIDEIASDLNLKAGTDLANINDSATTKIAHNVYPSNTYDDLTLGSTGAHYQMPADGWLYIDKTAGVANAYILFRCSDMSIPGEYTTVVPNTGNHCCLLMPVKKGVQVTVSYSATGTTNYFRFIYAEGSKWEK